MPAAASMTETTSELELISNLSISIVYVDEALDIRLLNPSAEALLSISASKAIGENLLDLIEVPDALLLRMQQTLHSGQPYTDRELAINLPINRQMLIDCTVSPWNRQGQTIGIVLELSPLDRQLKIARDEALLLQQQNSHSLVRGLAHEIKNPLGGIRGAAQLLQPELQDDSLHEYTDIIIRESDRLRLLIDRMLGPANQLEMQLLNIHEVLEHVRKIIRAEAASGILLDVDYDPSIPELVSDHDRLVQVFLNIAGNASEAVGDSGRIQFKTRVISNFTIGATRHKLVICAEIIDDGKGVSKQMQDQIFYPLVTGRHDGTGLGLSIAQTTVNQLGGLIECRSEPDQTVFAVYLPQQSEPALETGVIN